MTAQRRGRLLLFAGAALGLALAGLGTLAPGAASRAPGPGDFARVNGVSLASSELARALERIEADTKRPLSDEARAHVRERLIDDELLLQRAIALGLPASDPTARKSLVSALIGSVVADASSAAASETELGEFFAANRGYFASPGRARVARIFVRDAESADRRVEAALEALAAGVEPAQVGAHFGDATALELPDALLPEAKLRELLGPSQTQAALALAPGAHTPPLVADGGRVILVLLEREAGETAELAVVRAQVEAEWARRAGERALAAYLATLRREAEIRVGEDAQ